MDIEEIDERNFDIAPKRIIDETDVSKDFGEEDDAELKPEETTYLKRIEKALEDVSVKIPGSDESQYLEFNALRFNYFLLLLQACFRLNIKVYICKHLINLINFVPPIVLFRCISEKFKLLNL